MISDALATGAGLVLVMIYLVFIVALVALSIWLQWRILAKAGFNGALSLLILTGIGHLIIQLIMAFGKWPIETQLEALAGVRPATSAPPVGGPPVAT
jgi:hypothetical protein